VSSFKGAVPPLNSSLDVLLAYGAVLPPLVEEIKRVNFYSFLRQAITGLGRSITSTQSSSHSFATETGVPCNRLSWSSSRSFGGLNIKDALLKGYWLSHDAKGTRVNLCFLCLYWAFSSLFQRSLAVLFL